MGQGIHGAAGVPLSSFREATKNDQIETPVTVKKMQKCFLVCNFVWEKPHTLFPKNFLFYQKKKKN